LNTFTKNIKEPFEKIDLLVKQFRYKDAIKLLKKMAHRFEKEKNYLFYTKAVAKLAGNYSSAGETLKSKTTIDNLLKKVEKKPQDFENQLQYL